MRDLPGNQVGCSLLFACSEHPNYSAGTEIPVTRFAGVLTRVAANVSSIPQAARPPSIAAQAWIPLGTEAGFVVTGGCSDIQNGRD